jgi:hypothetical protein
LGYGEIRKIKVGTEYNASLLGAGTSDIKPMLSLPVLVNPQVPAYTGLVVDRRAVVSAAGVVSIATSTDRYFDSDSVALRATWHIGHCVPSPNRLGKFTIAGSGRRDRRSVAALRRAYDRDDRR